MEWRFGTLTGTGHLSWGGDSINSGQMNGQLGLFRRREESLVRSHSVRVEEACILWEGCFTLQDYTESRQDRFGNRSQCLKRLCNQKVQDCASQL